MARIIVKFDSGYCVWSTVVDAPVTMVCSVDVLRAHYKEEYGNHGLRSFNEQIVLADETGSSSKFNSKEYFIKSNHAGKDGVWISEKEIEEEYAIEA